MDIDRTNKRILALLANDARMTSAAIGRAIGLSRPAVQERITSMERAGTIIGYRTVVAEYVGLVHAMLFLQITERPCDRALQWLLTLQGVTSVVSLAGEIDAVVSVTLSSMADLSALNDTVSTSPLIRAAKSNVILRQYRSR